MSSRINYTGQQKIAILREHLIENVPVSEVCKRHGISVVNFYNWQKILFEEGAAFFGLFFLLSDAYFARNSQA
jgi:transposase-like protein